ncbi:MAG TPA: DUF1189 family protein [Desulfomonilaceae bacterium]|nr:DUF1189 family protein [Desulfomonilaceae bacterium]
MGIARKIIGIPVLAIVLIILAAVGLSTWSLVSTGGERIESLVDRGVEKYDVYLPEITIRRGEASIRGKQPYFVDTGEKDLVVVIDTREEKSADALDYLKDAEAGAVLNRDRITVKNQGKIQVIPLKEFPDVVLNSQNLRDMVQDYMPTVIRVGILLVAFYFFFVKLFQVLLLALIPYIATRSYNARLTYGQAVKISTAAMAGPVILDVLMECAGIRIPGWFILYFVIYSGILALLIRDLVVGSRSEASPLS